MLAGENFTNYLPTAGTKDTNLLGRKDFFNHGLYRFSRIEKIWGLKDKHKKSVGISEICG